MMTVLVPTMQFRIVRPLPDYAQILGGNEDRLQQLWKGQDSEYQEWRDVPIVGVARETLKERPITVEIRKDENGA
jgi:hypothetical protein